MGHRRVTKGGRGAPRTARAHSPRHTTHQGHELGIVPALNFNLEALALSQELHLDGFAELKVARMC